MGHKPPAGNGRKGVPVAALPLPQASYAPQDDEEWETEDKEEILGGHKDTEPENKTQTMIWLI